MEWDQRAFAWIYRSLKRARGRTDEPTAQEQFDQFESRLELLSRLLSGRRWEIVGVDDDGGVAPGVLYLPRKVPWIDDAEDVAALYVYRTVFGLTAQDLGLGTEPGADPQSQWVGMLLAVPTTEEALRHRYPGAEDLICRFRQLTAQFVFADWCDRASTLSCAARGLLGHGGPTVLPSAKGLEVADALVDTARGSQVSSRHAELTSRFSKRLNTLDGNARNHRIVLPWGRWRTPVSAKNDLAPAPGDPRNKPSEGTERQKRRRASNPELVDLDSQRDRDNPLVHSFEKMHTADEYRSGRRGIDGTDELAEHEEALEELTLDKVVRTPEAAASVYRADFESSVGSADVHSRNVELTASHYREWNYQTRAYREAWCTIREESCTSAASSVVVQASHRLRRHVTDLQAELRRLEYQRRWKSRQRDGTAIDIDAAVDRQATLAAGRTPDPRVYMRRRKHGTDLALHILLDASLSSDSWTRDARVFDVARDCSQIVVEALRPTDTDVSMAAFFSNTRRDCRFVQIKRAKDTPQAGLRRLHAVQPTGYTRVGPALRHATSVIAQSRARKRLIVVITDAKPTDYDRYEGRYGVEDVRQAVHEASRDGVGCVAWTIQAEGSATLSRMFGTHGWALLPNVRTLTHCFSTTVSPTIAAT